MYTAQRKVDADFSNKIILSDAAHFHLDGFENSQVIVEKQMQSQSATVFADFELEASSDHSSLKMQLVRQ